MNWMDGAIVAICIVFAIKGWANGFIKSVFSIVSFIISGIVTKMYYPVVSSYMLQNEFVISKIQKIIGKKIQMNASQMVSTEGSVDYTNIFDVLKFPKSMQDLLMKSEYLKNYSQNAMEGINNHVANMIANIVIDIISICIVFLIVKIVLSIILTFLNGFTSLPVLKELNSIGGITFGFLKGVIIVFIIFTILTPFTAMSNNSINMAIDESILGKILYNNNPIVGMVEEKLIGGDIYE
ncbi:CvpA family protein [Lutibacter sp. B2]|nr:CvpA family protein [Lutibacter sp. B2]